MIDVKKVAHLSRLKITDQEEAAFSEQLESICKYFEQLAEVDTEGVVPLVTPTDMLHELRPDEVNKWEASEALDQAPEKSGNLFKVPPVV